MSRLLPNVVSYPVTLLGLAPTLGTSSVSARELLGPWSAFIPVGRHGLRGLCFRFLHTLLANIKCQRTMSGVDWHPARWLLGPQGFTLSHRTATWPTRLRGTLPVTATESEITAVYQRRRCWHPLLQTPFVVIPELLHIKDLACVVRDSG